MSKGKNKGKNKNQGASRGTKIALWAVSIALGGFILVAMMALLALTRRPRPPLNMWWTVRLLRLRLRLLLRRSRS